VAASDAASTDVAASESSTDNAADGGVASMNSFGIAATTTEADDV